jgi:hypothetical protein
VSFSRYRELLEINVGALGRADLLAADVFEIREIDRSVPDHAAGDVARERCDDFKILMLHRADHRRQFGHQRVVGLPADELLERFASGLRRRRFERDPTLLPQTLIDRDGDLRRIGSRAPRKICRSQVRRGRGRRCTGNEKGDKRHERDDPLIHSTILCRRDCNRNGYMFIARGRRADKCRNRRGHVWNFCLHVRLSMMERLHLSEMRRAPRA